MYHGIKKIATKFYGYRQREGEVTMLLRKGWGESDGHNPPHKPT